MKTKTKPKTHLQSGFRTLRIEFHDGQAQAVPIAGTFNDWRPATKPMVHLNEDYWVKELCIYA